MIFLLIFANKKPTKDNKNDEKAEYFAKNIKNYRIFIEKNLILSH